jgi:hypothetical protein
MVSLSTWIKLRAVWSRFRAKSLMCRAVAIAGRASWIASWEDRTHRREVWTVRGAEWTRSLRSSSMSRAVWIMLLSGWIRLCVKSPILRESPLVSRTSRLEGRASSTMSQCVAAELGVEEHSVSQDGETECFF